MDSPDPTRRGGSPSGKDSILGPYTPEPAKEQMETRTDRATDERASLKHDSLIGGNFSSQYQTVPVPPAQDNIEETKSFAVQALNTSQSSGLEGRPTPAI